MTRCAKSSDIEYQHNKSCRSLTKRLPEILPKQVQKMKNIGIFFLLFFLTSCNENKIVKDSIILRNSSDVYDFKIKVHSHFNIIGDDSKIRFYLTDKDWNYLEKSFI